MTAGRYVYAKLKAAAGVTAIVGSGDSCRIYPLRVPQTEGPSSGVYPAIVYKCSNVPSDRHKTPQASAFTVTVTIVMWAATYTECEEMDLAVYAALDSTEGTAGGEVVKVSDYVGSEEMQDAENEYYARIATYKIVVMR